LRKRNSICIRSKNRPSIEANIGYGVTPKSKFLAEKEEEI